MEFDFLSDLPAGGALSVVNTDPEHCLMTKNSLFKPNKPIRGFTLIELLVVIAILGILSALLLPVLSKAKNRASQVTDLNNLKEQTTAINLYCTDHDDIIPWPNWDGGNFDRQGWLYKLDQNSAGRRHSRWRPDCFGPSCTTPSFTSARWTIRRPSLTGRRARNKSPATR